ncbi:TRAP transporter small permease [Roseospira goensis]|uniref:TRAP transporter small permease protein n=1 Tax=Roseospira goensis TaxID=391922 RepID=A0A7W6RYF1_9PROT|nr:TRAP transporter small permease [Roseospira goensis]MBB4285371.1 TRAP-type C4-dicarboxylate transport system permease small subunit [Roseospira goensis]
MASDGGIGRHAAAWARGLEVFSTWAAGLCLCVNIGVVLFGIVARYGFGSSPIWTDELARYALIWAVLLAGAAALRRGEHMQIDILVSRLPGLLGRAVDLLRRLAIFAVLLFMTVMGTVYAEKIWGMSTLALNVPRTIPTAAIPVGMGLMLVQFLLIQIGGPAARPPERERVTV